MTTPDPTTSSVEQRTEEALPEVQGMGAFSPGRRRFLALGATAAAGAAILAACGGDDGGGDVAASTDSESSSSASDNTTSTTAKAGSAADDLVVAELAAGLEVLAVGTYAAALDAAGKGALGAVPPAVAEFVTTVQGHHQAHLDKWNEVLVGAGKAKVTAPNATLKPVVDGEFAKVTDVVGAAKLALQLEEIAAATYLDALSKLSTTPAIDLAGSILPIDTQHAAVLHFVLGEYPVPDVFIQTDQSAAS